MRNGTSGGWILAFDLARGLAVVFMILIHVMRHWGEPSTWTTPIGVAASFLGGPPAAPVFMFLMGWHLPPALALAIVGFVLAWIAVCDQVVRRVHGAGFLGAVYGWSQRVQSMYLTHWILVGWGVGIVGFQKLGLGPVLVAMGLVVVLTSLLSMAYPVLAARSSLRHLRASSGAATGPPTSPYGAPEPPA